MNFSMIGVFAFGFLTVQVISRVDLWGFWWGLCVCGCWGSFRVFGCICGVSLRVYNMVYV